jgi:hypothetical protein
VAVALLGCGQSSKGAPGRPSLRYWGGPVIVSSTTHALFWEPPVLQDGRAAPVAASYDELIERFLADVGETSYYRVASQYYEVVGDQRIHVSPQSQFGGAYTDRSIFPPSPVACRGEQDCVSTDQVQDEIARVVALEHWAAGPSDVVLVYLPPGESDCDPGTGTGRCTDAVKDGWCSSHYVAGTGAATLLYAVVAYTDDGCQDTDPGGNLVPSPNRSVDADSAVSSTAHELVETVTDPQTDAFGAGSGWTTDKGDEIADLCESAAFTPYAYEHGRANVEMHGHFYMIQPLWSDRAGRCVLGS